MKSTPDEQLGDREIRTAALARNLGARLRACNLDELRVFDVLLDRAIELGRRSYGPLVIATDSRDFRREVRDELIDALFYGAAEIIRQRDSERAPLVEAAKLELEAAALGDGEG